MTVFLNSYGLVMRKPIVIFFACLAAAGAALGFTQVTWGSGGSDDSGFVGLTPARLLDSRQGFATADGNDAGAGRVQPGDTYALDVTGRVGIPADASVVNVNIVAVQPSGPGFLTVWPCSESRPLAAAVNYTTGVTIANQVSVTIGTEGKICIYSSAETDLVVDTYGFYQASSDDPERVVWVADDGSGDFLSLSAALASITDASATTPYLIKIAPGVYTETSNVAMKDYVDIEGSGKNVTTISCDCGGNGNVAGSSTISVGSANVEIRELAVENNGSSGGTRIGVYAVSPDLLISDVNIDATGASFSGIGVFNDDGGKLTLSGVDIYAEGDQFGIGVYGDQLSGTDIDDVVIVATSENASRGLYLETSFMTVTNSVIGGTTSSIFNNGGNGIAKLANSELTPQETGHSNVICVSSYNSSFEELDSDCTEVASVVD